jgi:hypothetical protein
LRPVLLGNHVGADFEGKTYAAFGQAIERPIIA